MPNEAPGSRRAGGCRGRCPAGTPHGTCTLTLPSWRPDLHCRGHRSSGARTHYDVCRARGALARL